MEPETPFRHPDENKLPDTDEIKWVTDLICPFLSDKNHLINCLGKNCGRFDECFSEMGYKATLLKLMSLFIPTLLALIFLAIILK